MVPFVTTSSWIRAGTLRYPFFPSQRLYAPTLATLLETTGPQFSLLIDMAFPEATYRVRVRVGLGQL